MPLAEVLSWQPQGEEVDENTVPRGTVILGGGAVLAASTRLESSAQESLPSTSDDTE